MVDIHTHILPGIDDGAGTYLEAVKMARQAADTGTRHMVASSHGICPDNTIGDYMNTLTKLRQVLKAENIPVTLYSGMEILMNEDAPALIKKNKFLPLNNTRYLLVEFNFNENVKNVCTRIGTLQIEGFKVILAHPERYKFMQREPGLAFFLEEHGCILQINKDSLLGGMGKKCQELAHLFLQRGLAGVIASDAHGTQVRSPSLDGLTAMLKQRYSKRQIHIWLSENPSRILKGDETVRLVSD